MMFFILHGFASATPNSKSAHISELFPNDTVVNLNYNFDPRIGTANLDEQIDKAIADNKREAEYVFVGTSLGGFYAQYLAKRFGGKAVAINPSVNPSSTLAEYIGKNKNFSTGEEFDFTSEMASGYSRYNIKPGSVPLLVFLNMGDEVIDSTETIKHFSGKAHIKTFAGGNHRFDNLADISNCLVEFAGTVVYI